MKRIAFGILTGLAAITAGAPPLKADPATFYSVSDVDFGMVEMLTDIPGYVKLATNGNITYSSIYSGSGVGTPGHFSLDGDTGQTVEISCETSGTLSDGSETFSVENPEIEPAPGTSFGNGSGCEGLGTTVLTDVLSSPDDDQFYLGLAISGTSPSRGGDYSTNNAGGDPIDIRVLYQ